MRTLPFSIKLLAWPRLSNRRRAGPSIPALATRRLIYEMGPRSEICVFGKIQEKVTFDCGASFFIFSIHLRISFATKSGQKRWMRFVPTWTIICLEDRVCEISSNFLRNVFWLTSTNTFDNNVTVRIDDFRVNNWYDGIVNYENIVVINRFRFRIGIRNYIWLFLFQEQRVQAIL